MNKDPVKIIIALGFTSVLTLMSLIAFLSISRMNASINELSILLEQTNAKITTANAMRDSIRLRGDTLNKIFLTNDFIEKDSLRLQLGTFGLDYLNSRNKLTNYPMSAQERQLLNTIISKTRSAKELNDTAAEILLSDDTETIVKEALLQASNARHNILDDLNTLITVQNRNAKNILKSDTNYQDKIINIIIILSLAAFFIAVLISLIVVRATSKKNTEIRYSASHDELTGLVNRKEFERQLIDAHKETHTDLTSHALCLLDLDEFKNINDTCGHCAGDKLLKLICKAITSNIRKHDTLARLGGDEFGLLLKNCSLEKAIEITEGLVSLVKNFNFIWEGETFHIGVSIGVAMLDKKTDSIKNIMQDADMACYTAKDMGKNQVQIHQLNDARMKKLQKELSWVADVNRSLKNDRFKLFIQPIKTLNADNMQAKYEIFLRLNDDEGTLVSPGSYIPAAERFNLMGMVDHWVIEETFLTISQLKQSRNFTAPIIFINISENALTDASFPGFVLEQYKKHNIGNHSICFEINEHSAIKHVKQTSAFIHTLKKHGILFALDNFGNALSSIQYLKDLHVDYLIIDGTIIKRIAKSSADKALVAAIHEVGKVMNIQTIAEHVEDTFTLNLLNDIGINYAQGFFFSRPESIEHLEHHLNPKDRQVTSSHISL